MAGYEHEIVVISPNSKKNISTQKYSVVRLHKNVEMVKELCEALDVPKDVSSVLDTYKPFKLEVLQKGNKQYHDLVNIFRGKSNQDWFNIFKCNIEYIHLVLNPYLMAQYNLKMLRKHELYGYCNDTMLFHGTKLKHVTSICKDNFNWRVVKTHLFGKGISFAQFAKYASFYPKHVDGDIRAIIMSMVSYTQKCEGEEDMVIPPFKGYDTAVKPNEDVWVKFEDGEYLPACVFYYKKNACSDIGNYEDEVQKVSDVFKKFAVSVDSMFNNGILVVNENDPNIVVIK